MELALLHGKTQQPLLTDDSYLTVLLMDSLGDGFLLVAHKCLNSHNCHDAHTCLSACKCLNESCMPKGLTFVCGECNSWQGRSQRPLYPYT